MRKSPEPQLTDAQLHCWARQVMADSVDLRLVTAQIIGRNNYADVEMGRELEEQCRLMERRARSEDRRARQRQGSL